VASNIAEGLAETGAVVTLFATGDSSTAGMLEYISPTAYCEDPGLDPKVWECLHISHLMEQASLFDIIHNNYDFLPLTYSSLIHTPMLTTIHGFSSPKILPVFKKYNGRTNYVSISNSDRHPELDYIATVYNGINTRDFTFQPAPGDYLLFFGRIHPEKGTLESILIAKKVKMKLIIAGLIQDETYFNKHIVPYINNEDIIYTGNAGAEQRNELLGHAFALLHPVSFEEPFGLSVVEAMYCGTPVIAFNRGSMPELVVHGKTGFLVRNADEAAEMLPQVKKLDRMDCHNRAKEKFTREKMVQDYLKVYKKILQS
jgi:glycosyltransferase involved in cell wall biosynthesis